MCWCLFIYFFFQVQKQLISIVKCVYVVNILFASIFGRLMWSLGMHWSVGYFRNVEFTVRKLKCNKITTQKNVSNRWKIREIQHKKMFNIRLSQTSLPSPNDVMNTMATTFSRVTMIRKEIRKYSQRVWKVFELSDVHSNFYRSFFHEKLYTRRWRKMSRYERSSSKFNSLNFFCRLIRRGFMFKLCYVRILNSFAKFLTRKKLKTFVQV